MKNNQPRKNEDADKTSIESLLRECLTSLRTSMTVRDANSFDETTDTIEMLISYDTNAYKDLTAYQQRLKAALRTKMEQIRQKSIDCQTTIAKRKYIKLQQYEYEWKYRKDYLFKIIDVFISRSILESEKPSPVKITKVK